jgi:hypothetical protein
MNPNRKHLSGSQKRKLQKEKELKAAKSAKIDVFFNKSVVPVNSVSDPSCSTQLVNISSAVHDSTVQTTEDTSDNAIVESITITAEVPVGNEHPTSHLHLVSDHPTDRSNFPVNITNAETKQFIVSHESCRPKGPFPKDVLQDRGFLESYYNTTTKSGLHIPRTWLCYSPVLDKAYCEPCWLFADRSNTRGYQKVWSEVYNDWKHVTSAIIAHEKSAIHFSACIVYEQWRLHGRFDHELEKQIRKETNFCRQVLHRLLNISLTLSMCAMPFRGHREYVRSGENNGNFLSIGELLVVG